jgi:hypothetical protein
MLCDACYNAPTEQKAQPFTAGPWQIIDKTTELGITGPWSEDTGHGPTATSIAQIHNFMGPEGQANARLIAAAPDLLEACNLAVNCLYNDDPATNKAIHALNAAIQKATTP